MADAETGEDVVEIIEKTPKGTFIKIKFLKRMIYERPIVEKKNQER